MKTAETITATGLMYSIDVFVDADEERDPPMERDADGERTHIDGSRYTVRLLRRKPGVPVSYGHVRILRDPEWGGFYEVFVCIEPGPWERLDWEFFDDCEPGVDTSAIAFALGGQNGQRERIISLALDEYARLHPETVPAPDEYAQLPDDFDEGPK